MGRGTSPLRSMVRGSPKKPFQENMYANVASTGELTPIRNPLSSISEGCCNPIVSSDENVGDAVTAKGKADGATPKGKKRGGQCLFPLSENMEGGTPDRQAKIKKSQSSHPSPAKSQSAVRVQESSVVEAGLEVASGEMAHAAAGIGAKGQAELQGAVKQGGNNANSHTPRDHVTKERGGKHGLESEPASSARPNCSQVVSATPAKSVTRTLKYGAAQGLVAAGASASRALIALPPGARNVAGATEQDHNVQVLIRTRPINSTEMVSQGFSKCLKQESPHTLTWVGPPETRFTFDHVAGEVVSQICYQIAFFIVAATCKFDKVIDFVGGMNFVILAVLTFLLPHTWHSRQVVITCSVVAWGVRLVIFLLLRILAWGEDKRFDDKRENLLKFAAFWLLQISARQFGCGQ